MRLIPDSHGLREYNHCHAPAGSPDGGQFCSAVDGVSTARDDTPEYVRDDSIKYWGPKRRTRVDTPGGPGIITGIKWKDNKAVEISVHHPHLTSPGQPFTFRTYAPKDVHPKGETAKDDTPTYGSIPSSLAKAGASQRKLEADAASHLNALPDGTTLKDGKTVWTKDKVGGDIFWTSSKGAKTSRQMFVDAAGKLVRAGLLPEHLRYGTAKDDTPEYGKPEKDIDEWTVSDNVGEFLDTITGWGYPNPIGTRDTWVFDDSRIVMDVIPKKEGKDWYIYLTGFQSIGGQGKGRGSAFLKRVTDLADKHGVTIRLTAEPLAVRKPMKKTPRERLVNFYKRHGFTRDADKAGRMFGAGSMIRKPVPADDPLGYNPRGGVYDQRTQRSQTASIRRQKKS